MVVSNLYVGILIDVKREKLLDKPETDFIVTVVVVPVRKVEWVDIIFIRGIALMDDIDSHLVSRGAHCSSTHTPRKKFMLINFIGVCVVKNKNNFTLNHEINLPGSL